MRNETNWGIFQDPMLTIIALILISTLGSIVPSSENGSYRSENIFEIESEVAELKESLQNLIQQAVMLEREVDKLYRLRPSESLVDTDNQNLHIEIKTLLTQVAVKTAELKRRRVELEQLHRASSELQKKKTDAEDQTDLKRQIEELQRSIAELERLLNTTKTDLQKASKRVNLQVEDEIKKEVEITGRLQRQIKAEEERLEQLQLNQNALKKALENATGVANYSSSKAKGKDELNMHCTGNRVVVINPTNYNVKTFHTMQNGRVVQVGKWTKKSSVRGENSDEVKNSSSAYQRALSKTTSRESYLLFFVNSDSFEAFLKAREIAWEKGFAVGWQAFNDDVFYSGVSSGGTTKVR